MTFLFIKSLEEVLQLHHRIENQGKTIEQGWQQPPHIHSTLFTPRFPESF